MRRVVIALIALVAFAHLVFYFPRVVDDMFIYLRYAEHAARGDGLAYNVGERVEGFSSVTWLLLLVPGEWLGANGVTYSKVLGIACLAALMVGQYYFARERLGIANRLLWLVGPAFTACCSYVVSWTVFGLETPLYLALMVWFAVTIGRYAEAPSRRTAIAAGVVGAAFALSRPEAPLVVAAITAATALRMTGTLRERAIRLAIGVAPAAGAYIAYAIFRRLYFGLWFPHTYYAKSAEGWHKGGLRQLWTDGASPPEVALVYGGLAIALYAAWRRRDALVAAISAVTIVYVAKVGVDWMPNVRFWLPVWVIVPLAWAWGVDEALARIARRARYAVAAAGLLALAATMLSQLGTDMRNSTFGHASRKSWTKAKSLETWTDTWRCLNREWPDYVAKQDKLNMGMVTQVWRLIESDARPLEDTWFVGSDIGMVGYLTPVNVWELPGLFTPDVRVLGEGWRRDHVVAPELLHAAMDRHVVMTELFDEKWFGAIRRDPVLGKRYEPTFDWYYVRERGYPPPTREQILERYRAAADKLPSSYFVMLMHGSALGAEVDRRVSIVRDGPQR